MNTGPDTLGTCTQLTGVGLPSPSVWLSRHPGKAYLATTNYGVLSDGSILAKFAMVELAGNKNQNLILYM